MAINMNLRYVSLFFMVPFSGYYITKLNISPVYIFLSTGALLSILLVFKARKFKFDLLSFIASMVLLYYTFTQLHLNEPDLPTFLNVVFSIFIFIISHAILYLLPLKKLLRLSRYLVCFSIPLLFIESVYRLTHPKAGLLEELSSRGAENLSFYAYKFNSLMYQDSNFVAMFILVLFFFWVYLSNFTDKKNYIVSCILIFLLIATISRAAIFTLFLFLILYKFKLYFYKYRYGVVLAGLFMTPFVFYKINNLSNLDGSLSSKFYIFEQAKEYFISTDWINKLFGVGFGNSIHAIGIGAHNFFVTNLVEAGLVGLILIIIFWCALLLKSNYKVGVVMFPFVFAGMSFASLAIPYVYIIYALILELEGRRYERR